MKDTDKLDLTLQEETLQETQQFTEKEEHSTVEKEEIRQLNEEEVEQKVYYKELSPTQMVLRRFFRSRLSVIGLIMIIALFVFAFLGPLLFKVIPINMNSGTFAAELSADGAVLTLKGLTDEDAILPIEFVEDQPNGDIGYLQLRVEGGGFSNQLFRKKVKTDSYNKVLSGASSISELISGKWNADDNLRLTLGKDGEYSIKKYGWGETEIDDTNLPVKISGNWIDTSVNGEQQHYFEFHENTLQSNAFASPSSQHLLGTDDKGMDVFSRLMYGGRVSLTLGFVVVILETLLGVILGGISGYFGGWVDQIIMRVVDILNCIPTLPLLLIASVVIDSWGVDGQLRIYYLMVILTIFGWSGTARMVRGQILYLREQEYIVACEVMGIPTWRRIFKHLIPNIMPQLIVSMTLGLGSIILYEATLSYLGLGIPIPYAAWGTMISSSTDPITMSYYPNLWIPAGLLIVIAVLGFNFVGDGLRDAMDPKARK